jgi:hypothetical protein
MSNENKFHVKFSDDLHLFFDVTGKVLEIETNSWIVVTKRQNSKVTSLPEEFAKEIACQIPPTEKEQKFFLSPEKDRKRNTKK